MLCSTFGVSRIVRTTKGWMLAEGQGAPNHNTNERHVAMSTQQRQWRGMVDTSVQGRTAAMDAYCELAS